MGTDSQHNLKDTKAKLDYLKELLTDRNILANDPRTYLHVGKILEKEILRIRSALFATYGINPISDSDLPEPEGPKVNLQTKVYMPTDSVNSFNFVGRILGPDGSTAKCLQQCLGVKIMVRGRGSMRDRKKEEANIGKPNWEHLSDRLHVVLTVEDHENRAKARLAKASEYITVFLKESMKGSDKDDKVKQMQLMELSFRREPGFSWRFNCNNNLLDMSFPQKPGTIFSNTAANFFNFGYAYPPSAPLFSPLHHGSISSAGPLGPFGHAQQQQQQQHQHQPHHQTAVPPSQPQPTQAMGNPTIAAGYSHAYANNLSAATFLLSHSPNSAAAAAGYASPYSPNSHTQSAGGAPGLAVAPMSYWAGQGMPGADYAFAQPPAAPAASLNNSQQQQQITEVASSASSASSSIVLNANGTTAQNGVYLTPRATATTKDLMQQYVMTDLNACTVALDGFRELNLNHDGRTVAEPYADTTATIISVNGSLGNGHNNAANDRGTISAPSDEGMGSGSKRYSQKHASCRTNPVARGGGRSAVVTVRVGSSDASENNVKLLQEDSGGGLLRVSSIPSKNGISRASSDTDEDWPKLGASGEKDVGACNRSTGAQVAENNAKHKTGVSLGEDGKQT